MSATPPTDPATPDPAAYPALTDADYDAMFASVVWFREKCPKELLERCLGMHVAILGEQIIDADRDVDELFRRLDAKGDAAPRNRVVVQYLPTVEELLQY